jgi:hypothetical protein
MAKSRKQILQELLDLENEKVEEVEESQSQPEIKPDCINGKEVAQTPQETPLLKQKKPRTEKQLQAFEKAKAIRDANAAKRKEEQRIREEQAKKIAEEKIVKKAIAIKKKEIKKQAVLDEISDDDTPIEKVKQIATKQSQEPPKPTGPIIRFF